MGKQLYYMQDTRQYVGNDISWWATGSMGYTTDVSKAQIWSEFEAFMQQKSRSTDRPWPKEYIDSHTRPVIDMQCVDYEVATQDTP